ncbi:MAG: hypothetical protein JW932_03895 [Deltaproteobacteria bacterium]|nr:hypothetical protein [Deltaproteobacteria bacterium]
MELIENIKALVEATKKLKDRKIMELVINVETSLLEFQSEFDRLRERTALLEKENEALKMQKEISRNLSYEKGVYFNTIHGDREGPFCTRCWDADYKLVRLAVQKSGIAQCPECRSFFEYEYK